MVIRDKAKMSFVVDIGEVPSEEELAKLEGRQIKPKGEVAVEEWRGIEVSSITKDIAMRFNIRNKEGVLIVNVKKGSPASYANLRGGDVIRRINTKIIKTIEDYRDAIKDSKGDILIHTDRGFTIIKEGK